MNYIIYNEKTKLYSFNFLEQDELSNMTCEAKLEYQTQLNLWLMNDPDSEELQALFDEAKKGKKTPNWVELEKPDVYEGFSIENTPNGWYGFVRTLGDIFYINKDISLRKGASRGWFKTEEDVKQAIDELLGLPQVLSSSKA